MCPTTSINDIFGLETSLGSKNMNFRPKTLSRGKIGPFGRLWRPHLLSHHHKTLDSSCPHLKPTLICYWSLAWGYFFRVKMAFLLKNTHFQNRHYINHYITSNPLFSKTANCRILKLGRLLVLIYKFLGVPSLLLCHSKNGSSISREVWNR